jgi:predicted metalloprotease with PDZ domain
MRDMYNEFYLKKNVWFTEEDLEKELVTRLGQKGKAFLDSYIHGLERPDWVKAFGEFGIKITDRNTTSKALTFGFRLQASGNRFLVQSIPNNGPAFLSGLQLGDEVVAIEDRRIENPDLTPFLGGLKAGYKVNLTISRSGAVRQITIEIKPDPAKAFRLEWMENATPDQDFLRKKWLRLE